jgi:enoyl-CoA hydratase
VGFNVKKESFMTTTFNHLSIEHYPSGILQITLNRPDKLNALSTALLEELHTLLHNIKKDKTVKALLITGAGEKAFCAGADINRLAELDATQGFKFAQRGQHIFRHLEEMGKPTLAAINGYAFGGGCELAMATTIRIASNNAMFAQPEVKLGVIPGYGGTQRLSRLVGKGRALELCLTGRSIKAEEALMWGLITEITTPETLLTRAHEILNSIINLAPLAVKSVMNVIEMGYDLPLDEALRLETLEFALLCASQDKQEGVNAFLQKRTAEFKGE